MTDPTTPSSEPTPPAASAPPAYTPATGDAHHAGGKRGLSLTGFILGIVSVVFSFIFAPIGLISGIVGLIISIVARRREPGAPNWMKILGLVFSIVGIVLGLIFTIIFIVAIAALAQYGTYSN